MDMKKEFPSQTENRKQWIIDSVRANQHKVGNILLHLYASLPEYAREMFVLLHKHDQDALLLPGGILTDEQIEILSPGRLSSNTETDQ